MSQMSHAIRTNELSKMDYFRYLEHARGLGAESISQSRFSIGYLEDYLGANFSLFNQGLAIEFKSFLIDHVSIKTGKPLSSASMKKILFYVRDFLTWFAAQKKYKPTFSAADVAYLSPTSEMAAVTRRNARVIVPDIAEFVQAVQNMPSTTIFERRDQAAMALLALSGARGDALTSFRLNSVNIAQRLVDQDGILVRTKRKKRILTWFFPVGEGMFDIIARWMETLRTMGYSGEDPLFPADVRMVGPNGLLVSSGLSKCVWESETPIRKIFQRTCEAAGIACRHPHAIRRSLVKMAFRSRCTLEQLKAISQNLGHSGLETTLFVYGEVPDDRREEIMQELWMGQAKNSKPDTAAPPQLEPLIAVLRGYGYTVTSPSGA